MLHLYEHVVSIVLHNFLRGKKYYCYVDYAIRALTYDKEGFCELSVEVYNDDLLSIIDESLLSKLTINESIMIAAYYQLLGEESATFVTRSGKLQEEILKLHAIPWTQLDLDVTNSAVSGDTILVQNTYLPTYEYKITIHVKAGDFAESVLTELLLLTGHNLQVFLSNKRGYYRQDLITTGNEVMIVNIVAYPLNETINSEADILMGVKLIEEIIDGEVFARLNGDTTSSSAMTKVNDLFYLTAELAT